MKKSNYIFVVALVGMLALAGCTFLDSDNKSTVTADEQFATESGWNQLLNQAYFKMRTIYSSPLLFCAGTDMYTTGQGAAKTPVHTYTYNADEAIVQDLYENLYATVNAANCVLKYSANEQYNDEAKFIRAYCYYILTQQFGAVPYIAEYIETASSNYPRTPLNEVYSQLEQELKQIIDAKRLPELPDAAQGRGRASLIAAKALLAKVYLAAAWDLDVKANDLKGTYQISATDRFQKALRYAEEVTNAVPLTQTFAQKWDFDFNESGANAETLFAIQYDRATSSDQATGGHDQQHYFGVYMGSNSTGVKALKNDLAPTERVYLGFEKNDQRFDASFMTTIYGYDGDDTNWSTQGYWGAYNAKDVSARPIAWRYFPWYTTDDEINGYLTANAANFVTTGLKKRTKVLRVADKVTCWAFKEDGSKDDAASTTYSINFSAAINNVEGLLPPCKKFDDKNTTSSVQQKGGTYRDIVVLNASEIYLSAAEAALMLNDPQQACNFLKQVRQRAGLTTPLNSFADYTRYDWELNQHIGVGATDSYGITITELDVILDERMRETLGEYYRWMDLRRTKQLARYAIAYGGVAEADMRGNDGNLKLLRPIPTNELQINTGINPETDQNPGF